MMILFLLVVSMFGKTLFAEGNDNVSREAKEAFDKRFPDARSDIWDHLKNADVYQVNFLYHNQQFVGYINEEGEVIGIASDVINERLPFIIDEAIAKKYPGYQVRSAVELIKDGELGYLFTVVNEKSIIYTQVNSNGEVHVIKKTKQLK